MPDDDQEGKAGAPEAPAKKKGKPKLLYLIILVVLALGGGGGYYFFGHKIMGMLPGKSAAPESSEKAKEKGKDKEKEKDKAKKHVPGAILTMEPFVFNIAGQQSRFAKISVALELKNQKVEEEAKKSVPAMRDKILLVLGVKPAEAFLDVAQRDKIKEELQESLKGLFKESEDLNAVYVTDIIIQ